MSDDVDRLNRVAADLGELFLRLGRALAEHGAAVFDSVHNTLCAAMGGEANVTMFIEALEQHHLPADPFMAEGRTPTICMYCGCDMPNGVFGWPTEHQATCPTLTDLWPVNPIDLMWEIACEICGHPFALGEHYTTKRDIRCIGCSVTEDAS